MRNTEPSDQDVVVLIYKSVESVLPQRMITFVSEDRYVSVNYTDGGVISALE